MVIRMTGKPPGPLTTEQIHKMQFSELEPLFEKHLPDKEFAGACAKHPDSNVVVHVAFHEKTHPDTLRQLAEEGSVPVAVLLTMNDGTPLDVLEKLTEHLNPDVREAARERLEKRRAEQQE